jgi:SNF2 family DNA or RNA helicase
LHNWQREVTRFAPQLKVLPYWGTQSDRKIIRKVRGNRSIKRDIVGLACDNGDWRYIDGVRRV